MRLLVTGASGLLGLNLGCQVSDRHAVTGVVHSHPLTGVPFSVRNADLLQAGAIERLLDEVQPEAVIHTAALALLETCEADPEQAWKTNAELPGRLAQATSRAGVRLLHISTDAVFDGQRGGYTEEDQPRPLSMYGRSKLAGERAVLEADPSAIVARVNFYGWSLRGKRSLAEWFFNNLSAGKPIQGFTDVYFCPLLVNDLAELLVRMLQAGLGGLYHVISPECLTKFDFGVALAREFSLDERLISPASVADGGLKAPRATRLCLRGDKLARDLGVLPPGQTESLRQFHRLYQDGYPAKIKTYAA